jgi:hypothetical protein
LGPCKCGRAAFMRVKLESPDSELKANPVKLEKNAATNRRGGSQAGLWKPLLCGLKLLQIGQYFLAVLVRIDLEVHLFDHARGVDQERVALG